MRTAAGVTGYAYDEQNRLKAVTDPDLAVTSYFYDVVGNLSRVELPNGMVETRTYDELNRLELLQYQKDGVMLQSFDYTLDLVGQRRVVTEQNGRQVEYEYDDLYRLSKETIFAPAGGVDRTIGYGYDAVGNRLTKTDSVAGVTSYIYDDNDRLLREELRQNGVVVGTVEYGYDGNGNTKTRTKKNAAGVVVETVTYSWNQENRLAGVLSSNGDAVSYSYDTDGVRVSKTVNGVKTEFLVDKNRDYAQVLEERVNGVVAASYVYGLDLISQERGNVDSYYLVDGLGSTRGLTDASGVVTDTYTYDAFGNLIANSGGTANNYLFAGEHFDSNIDQYYLRQRYYNPNSGRFTRRDTYEGSFEDPITLHKYLYGNANPVTYTDPTGLFSAGEAQAAADIANTLAGIQWESGSHLIGATLSGGEYGLVDILLPISTLLGTVGIGVLASVVWGRLSYNKLLSQLRQHKGFDQLLSNAGYNPTTNPINASTLEHVLTGEINKRGKAVGFHYRATGDTALGTIVTGILKTRADGIYEATVNVQGVQKRGFSTFFPDNYSVYDVLQAGMEAYNSRTSIPGRPANYFEGTSSKGLKIGGYLTPSGSVSTFYPIY